LAILEVLKTFFPSSNGFITPIWNYLWQVNFLKINKWTHHHNYDCDYSFTSCLCIVIKKSPIWFFFQITKEFLLIKLHKNNIFQSFFIKFKKHLTWDTLSSKGCTKNCHVMYKMGRFSLQLPLEACRL
jgi:hypothetical protein